MCASWCALSVGGMARSKVSSQIQEASSLGQVEEEGRFRLPLWTAGAEGPGTRTLKCALGKGLYIFWAWVSF